MSFELKIKAASLAAEAHIIRRIERKLKKLRNRVQIFPSGKPQGEERGTSTRMTIPGKDPEGYARWGNAALLRVQNHRRGPVRHQARLTHLARMFLKGVPYKQVEQKVHPTNRLHEGSWKAIQKMAEVYAPTGPRSFWLLSNEPVAKRFERWMKAE